MISPFPIINLHQIYLSALSFGTINIVFKNNIAYSYIVIQNKYAVTSTHCVCKEIKSL